MAYTLAYDYDGQLASITQGSTVTSFGYDATGRRVTRTAGGTTTRFYYDGGQIVAEKQGSTTTAVVTYGEGLIRKDSEYPLFDGQGSERTVTNSSQTVVGTLNLDAFGNRLLGIQRVKGFCNLKREFIPIHKGGEYHQNIWTPYCCISGSRVSMGMFSH